VVQAAVVVVVVVVAVEAQLLLSLLLMLLFCFFLHVPQYFGKHETAISSEVERTKDTGQLLLSR
jgi:hypothetical protein